MDDRASAEGRFSAIKNVSDNSMSSDSQEKEADICLKCENVIAHIPYKYNGQTFHARCLNCNNCGKKLVGKPFITDKNLIFCGDQCKQGFEQKPRRVTGLSDTQEGSKENTDSEAHSQSLMDALESIKDSQQDIMRLNRQVSPLQKMQDPDRITDYPRGPSPNVSMLSLNSRRSSLSSRRSSLSAMSQSSLTSDSSFDANKKPGKKILKNPHRSSRQSKNRVRWKLPNSDSDTMSVDSFESTTTVGSSVYNRAKSGVLTARQNWREFEQSPPRGSTGITPMKTATRQMRGSYSTGALYVHPYSPPGNLGTIPQDKVVSDLGSKSTQTLTTSKPTPSPLTYNTSANNSSSPGGLLHSTPIRHTQSASNIDFRRQMQLHKQSPNTTSDIRVPILRLDNSNLTDLEESTLEDKKRMHIFQFPQPSEQAQNSSRPVLASADLTRSKQSAFPPTIRTTAVALDDDDANDYDHLSPLHENKVKKQEKGKEIKKDTDKSIYSDQDLDEALDVIAKESSTGGSGLPGISRTKKEEQPPLVPPKKHFRTRIGAVGSEATANVHRSDFITPKPPISTTAPSLTQTQSNHDTGRSSQGNDGRNSSVKSLQQVPPPIPPKMRRKKQQSSIFPPGSQSAKEAAYLPNHRQLRVQGSAVLQPAPEVSSDRQTRPNNSSPPQSHSSTEEDPMASESNSTLIEQEGTTPKGSKFNATPSPVGPAVVYPVTSQPVDNQQSWKPLELRDRIVVGAENPGPPVDKRLTTSSTNQLQNSRNMKSKPSMPSQDSYSQSLSQDMQYFQNNAFFAGSYSQPDTTRPSGFMVTSHYGQPARMSNTSRVGQTTRAPEEKSTVPTSPRYKFSLETALTDGNLMKSLSYAPQSHSVSASQPNETAATQRPQVLQRPRKSMTRSQSVGQSSRPAGLSNASLSSEEQYVRQRFYSGSKLPMDKPVVHVKDQSVSQLLRELDINDKKQTVSTVMCKVCKKTIQGSSYTMHGENYHSRCYKCATCGSMLRGKKSFTVNHQLLCKDCFARKDYSTSGPDTDGNARQQEHYRRNFQLQHDIQRSTGRHNNNTTSV